MVRLESHHTETAVSPKRNSSLAIVKLESRYIETGTYLANDALTAMAATFLYCVFRSNANENFYFFSDY